MYVIEGESYILFFFFLAPLVMGNKRNNMQRCCLIGRYLKNKVKLEERHRFHFFNSFFFRKLADLDKDQSRACESTEAFQRVRKWTRKVDIFEKDYIFIPVNFRSESCHYSLQICIYLLELLSDMDYLLR